MNTNLICIIGDLGDGKVMYKLNCAAGCSLCALFCFQAFPLQNVIFLVFEKLEYFLVNCVTEEH